MGGGFGGMPASPHPSAPGFGVRAPYGGSGRGGPAGFSGRGAGAGADRRLEGRSVTICAGPYRWGSAKGRMHAFWLMLIRQPAPPLWRA
jgi:hypothetical protein